MEGRLPTVSMMVRGRDKHAPWTVLARLSTSSILRKYVGRPFLTLNARVWSLLAPSFAKFRLAWWYGDFLHTLVRLHADRTQNHGTFFFRNRPQLALIRRLVDQKPKGSTLRISVLASSNGSEVYSILWTIRSARPDLKVIMHAVDISNEVVQIAREGVYLLRVCALTKTTVFDRATEEEIRAMFDREGDQARIKSWIKEGIVWQVWDAGDPALVRLLGPQDIVVGNNFLCHMDPASAEKCLRNIASLVNPGGYLFVSGIDLDVRTKVALDSGWTPVRELLEEIHDGDPCMRRDWPWKYWGLQPLNKKKAEWQTRYAAVFRIANPQRY
jgi:SAM-dependent methyltransferase